MKQRRQIYTHHYCMLGTEIKVTVKTPIEKPHFLFIDKRGFALIVEPDVKDVLSRKSDGSTFELTGTDATDPKEFYKKYKEKFAPSQDRIYFDEMPKQERSECLFLIMNHVSETTQHITVRSWKDFNDAPNTFEQTLCNKRLTKKPALGGHCAVIYEHALSFLSKEDSGIKNCETCLKNATTYIQIYKIATELLKNSTNMYIKEFIEKYISNIAALENNKISDDTLLRFHTCIKYINSVSFDITDWELCEIPIEYAHVFRNIKDNKYFDLDVFSSNLTEAIPTYLKDSGEHSASSIEEAIEKYSWN